MGDAPVTVAAACGLLGWGHKRMASELGVSYRWVYDQIRFGKRPKRLLELALLEILNRNIILYGVEI